VLVSDCIFHIYKGDKMSQNFKFRRLMVHTALVHLIQETTGDSTEEVFSYFYEIAVQIINVAIGQTKPKSKGTRISKTLLWQYKDTKIPYRLSVGNSWPYELTSDGKYPVYMDVKFPGEYHVIDVDSTLQSVLEQSLNLDGAEALKKFPKPKTRVPRGLNDYLAAKSPLAQPKVDYDALPANLRAKYQQKV
jgi:hypothetical protein